MSCIRFNTPTQTNQMRAIASVMLIAEQVAAVLPASPVTEGIIRRLGLRVQNPKIRASVARRSHRLNHEFADLAHDNLAPARA